MKRVVAILLVAFCWGWAEKCLKDDNKTLDIDCAIAQIMKAPPQKRRILMNELKRKIFELNLELQSSHLLHLQNIIGNRPTPSKGHHR